MHISFHKHTLMRRVGREGEMREGGRVECCSGLGGKEGEGRKRRRGFLLC